MSAKRVALVGRRRRMLLDEKNTRAVWETHIQGEKWFLNGFGKLAGKTLEEICPNQLRANHFQCSTAECKTIKKIKSFFLKMILIKIVSGKAHLSLKCTHNDDALL